MPMPRGPHISLADGLGARKHQTRPRTFRHRARPLRRRTGGELLSAGKPRPSLGQRADGKHSVAQEHKNHASREHRDATHAPSRSHTDDAGPSVLSKHDTVLKSAPSARRRPGQNAALIFLSLISPLRVLVTGARRVALTGTQCSSGPLIRRSCCSCCCSCAAHSQLHT